MEEENIERSQYMLPQAQYFVFLGKHHLSTEQ